MFGRPNYALGLEALPLDFGCPYPPMAFGIDRGLGIDFYVVVLDTVCRPASLFGLERGLSKPYGRPYLSGHMAWHAAGSPLPTRLEGRPVCLGVGGVLCL
jgi:hypothetical protein